MRGARLYDYLVGFIQIRRSGSTNHLSRLRDTACIPRNLDMVFNHYRLTSALGRTTTAEKPSRGIISYKPVTFAVPRTRADYAAIHEIADSLEPKLRRAFLEAVEKLRDAINYDLLVRHLKTQAALQALGTLSIRAFEVDYGSVANKIIAQAVTEAGQVAETLLPVRFKLRFDLTNPRVFDWIENHTGDLIRQVSTETKLAVRSIIDRGFREGRTVDQMARDIKQVVGLTKNQANAVMNYEKRLIEEKIKPQRTEKLVERYRQKMLRLRASNIARTETITASARGQQLLWQQGADEGLINETTWQRKWIVTRDDRTCPLCMDMAGKTAPIRGTYPGGIQGPALHNGCRCAEGIVEVK